MCWIGAVVNMMVARGDNEIFQPGGFPGHVHMHPGIAGDVLHGDQQKNPFWHFHQQRFRRNESEIKQNDVRDRSSKTGKPVHVVRIVMPLVGPPQGPSVHEAMNPIKAEILHDVKQSQLPDDRHVSPACRSIVRNRNPIGDGDDQKEA